MFERLLIPLTGTPRAEAALPWATVLPGTLVYLLRVVPQDPGARQPGFDRGEADLQQVARTLDGDGRAVETLLGRGDPGQRIVEAAADVDCIVMVTAGRTGTARALIGSVSDHVVRHAPCPVLFVPANATAPAVDRVVIPLDGSALAETALPVALGLADHLGVPLALVQVRPRDQPPSQAYLEEVAGRYRDTTVVTTAARTGDVVAELRAAIGARDLVVMTTHGRHGLRRLVLGSVASALLHDTRDPRLLVGPRARPHGQHDGDPR